MKYLNKPTDPKEHVLYLEDVYWLNQMSEQHESAIISAQVGNVTDVPIDLKGTFVVTESDNTPTAGDRSWSWTDGIVYWNGRVYHIQASATALVGTTSQTLLFTASESNDTNEPHDLTEDGLVFSGTHAVRRERTLTITAGTAGTADFDLADIRNYNSAWQTPTLGAGYSNSGSLPVVQYAISLGQLHIKGAFESTSSGTGTLFTLPARFRPTSRRIKAIGGQSASTDIDTIDVDTDGTVEVKVVGTTPRYADFITPIHY